MLDLGATRRDVRMWSAADATCDWFSPTRFSCTTFARSLLAPRCLLWSHSPRLFNPTGMGKQLNSFLLPPPLPPSLPPSFDRPPVYSCALHQICCDRERFYPRSLAVACRTDFYLVGCAEIPRRSHPFQPNPPLVQQLILVVL